MEVRIAKMEQELVLMRGSLTSISKTLEKMSDIQINNKLLEERLMHLDKDLQESFARVHIRMDKGEATISWITRLVVGTVIVIVLGVALKGGVV